MVTWKKKRKAININYKGTLIYHEPFKNFFKLVNIFNFGCSDIWKPLRYEPNEISTMLVKNLKPFHRIHWGYKVLLHIKRAMLFRVTLNVPLNSTHENYIHSFCLTGKSWMYRVVYNLSTFSSVKSFDPFLKWYIFDFLLTIILRSWWYHPS